MEKKVDPKLRQEVKVKVDIVTSDDIKIYYTGKFQDFTARDTINSVLQCVQHYFSNIKPQRIIHGCSGFGEFR